jgi:hypothetical protein
MTRLHMLALLASAVLLQVGCAATTADIDVSNKEPVCARQCTTSFSQCIGNAIGMPQTVLGGTCGGRTHDKRIKSPLLYQLS